ncbi:MAG TPA: polymer-forming cytoskeletal protein [Burkholderiaceae bacterium]|mgnify:CR=1 FL=1|jgi:cytoskeletal protein CcmA (bactofilin family)|nr:polymer-forming cytoskeletal protein [Burkholderiaceae bacterium]
MFGSKKGAVGPIESLIGHGTVIEGDVRFKGGLRIDGEVLGSVSAADGATGALVISEQGSVRGPVRAAHLILNGLIEGPVQADEVLELQSKAKIVGNVRYRSLEMHPGAIIDGALSPLDNDRPALKLAVSKD